MKMNAPVVTDEKALLIKLRSGDRYAFEKIYNLYKLRLAANFIKLLRSDELAQDALQDLFTKVWHNRKNIDPEQSFRSYLFRIAENLVVDFYRKAARDKDLEAALLSGQDGWYSHVEERLFSREKIELVRTIIARLPEQQRKVYTLHKIEGNSYKEISKQMGISTSTINKHVHYAHKFVRSQLMAIPGAIALICGLVLVIKWP